MKLELLMKVPDLRLNDEEDQEAYVHKVISGEEKIPIAYKSFFFDIKDVVCSGEDDEEHTKIVTPYAIFYAKIDYPTFTRIYESSLGERIKTINDYKFM